MTGVPISAEPCILILEDEPLILMDLEQQVRAWALGRVIAVPTAQLALKASKSSG
jgi:hypothetical protein